MGLQEALHQRQTEGAKAIMEAVSALHAQRARVMLAKESTDFLVAGLKLAATDVEEEAFLEVLFATVTAIRPWRAIMPSAVIEAADKYVDAAGEAAFNPMVEPTAKEAYLTLLATMRRELGVDPLSDRTVALMRAEGKSALGRITPW